MAKVTAPFLSIAARGGIAETLQALRWKNIQVMRKWQGNIQTPSSAQLLQRTVIAAAVGGWHSIVQGFTPEAAWERAARRQATHESAWSMWIKSAPYALRQTPFPSYVRLCHNGLHGIVHFHLVNLVNHMPGDEAGNFDIMVGPYRAPLSRIDSVPIAAGIIETPYLGTGGTKVEIDIRKDGYSRSGVWTITLLP